MIYICQDPREAFKTPGAKISHIDVQDNGSMEFKVSSHLSLLPHLSLSKAHPPQCLVYHF